MLDTPSKDGWDIDQLLVPKDSGDHCPCCGQHSFGGHICGKCTADLEQEKSNIESGAITDAWPDNQGRIKTIEELLQL